MGLYIKHYMHSIRQSVQKFIDNICNTSPRAWKSEMNIISSVLAPNTLSVLIFNLMTSCRYMSKTD